MNCFIGVQYSNISAEISGLLSLQTVSIAKTSSVSDICNILVHKLSSPSTQHFYLEKHEAEAQWSIFQLLYFLTQNLCGLNLMQCILFFPYHILSKYNLIFKVINFTRPLYLSSVIKTNSLTCGNRLLVSSVHPKLAIGRRAFATATSVKWKRLPLNVRSQQTISSLRSQPKTYWFTLAYPPP